ncbi:MAG: DUF378 domain-containing protein [Ramlibacter sp.]
MAEYEDRSSAVDPAVDDPRRPRRHVTVGSKNLLDWLALLLLIVGGLNWGLVGLFGIDLVSEVFGPGSPASRAIYVAVGVAALWGFALMRLAPARRP